MVSMTNTGHFVTKSGRIYSKTPGRPIRKGPVNPDKVLRIVWMREVENKRYRQIAEELGLSRQAPFLLHKRWRDWGLKLINNS